MQQSKNFQTKVIVGMSGGVDSSIAAWLLQKQGYRVEGCFMKNWEEDDHGHFCAAELDLADAIAVCNQLNIPLHQVNFAQEYWNQVFTHFLDECNQGRTPNPDVLCNKVIKFGYFVRYAQEVLGADYVATGHYAKINYSNGSINLMKAKDSNKDQTYFLHAIGVNNFDKIMFPLGDYYKHEVREFAQKLNLINYAKKDSTGICFIGEKKFKTFLNEYILAQPGEIHSIKGQLIGRHDGLMFYTIGQRDGLGIGGLKGASDKPWYVVEKHLKTNRLIVAQGKNHPRLYASGLICGSIHWLVNDKITLPLTCDAQIRYRQTAQSCQISSAHNAQHYVFFSTPQWAITPGQYIVFYANNQCLGGAIIEDTIK